MEQLIWFGITLAFGAFMFWAGQKSVKQVGYRVERYQASPSQSVEVVTPEAKGLAPYAQDVYGTPGIEAPPQFRHLVERWKNEQRGSED